MSKVIDDFLPHDEFKQLSEFILSPNFPWYHQVSVALKDNAESDLTCNHYFTHNLVYPGEPPQISHLHEPIWNDHFHVRFGDIDIIRMKVNAFPATTKVYEHHTHTDFDFPHKGALLCLNTCDGYTQVGDTTIPSVANRMIFFDTSKPHNSTSCTDQPLRANIVINYLKS